MRQESGTAWLSPPAQEFSQAAVKVLTGAVVVSQAPWVVVGRIQLSMGYWAEGFGVSPVLAGSCPGGRGEGFLTTWQVASSA